MGGTKWPFILSKKNTVVFFTRKYNFHKKVLPKVNKIKMGGVEIKPSQSMTYLGVILDQKLNWSLHIHIKVAKVIKWLAVLKPAIDNIYGLSPARMLWIYRQILLPRITLDLPPVDDFDQVTGNKGVLLPAHVPKGTVKVVELTLELFDRNYNLYAQRINHHDDGLFIRAILMKDNIIIFNNTFKILGTSNVAIATIASADQVCNQYMVHARKGDSFICALGDGQHGV